MWSGLCAAAELGGLFSAAVFVCREVWDAVSRWSIWVTLARAGRGLRQTGGGQGGHSTGDVMGKAMVATDHPAIAQLRGEEVSELVWWGVRA